MINRVRIADINKLAQELFIHQSEVGIQASFDLAEDWFFMRDRRTARLEAEGEDSGD